MADERRPPAARPTSDEPRRGFMRKLAAVVVGMIVGIVPLVISAVAFFDPLIRSRRKAEAAGDGDSEDHAFLRITTLQNLPPDGTPRLFPVIADLQDAWNKFPQTEIGSVYLWRTSEGGVQCFNARCPHLGCTVNYKADAAAYICPCHDSSFALDGERNNDIPPRNMDPLEAEVRDHEEVWVKFEKFRAGIHEREVV